ncbi:PSD1 and planctomycete cytochrome C domain-containing protein [Cyclobacterium jeungdonense]|uniref:PSD1 and planctomycete cytochrome C domain-containing protein n=1 Tax=Cyclobacterium jeungdonense TaxID=708087 RepID=A0ABT8CE07_9BACT|nr:PSD1 and planctomycete cytochrome C domain-containing protein [Cyclobacterium jeungdonense]MDN3690632.1 PSD1 and planctomycete cytochrome C domain-containing protein [Cyclobacterium jeungdonense]
MCLLLIGCGGESNREQPMPETISYNLHIRPILSENCFACHGPDANKRESGLRLDREEDAFSTLKEQPDRHALVPGNPDASEAYLRILSSDQNERMPPPSSNLSLSDNQIQLIEKWIGQGAEYEPHWAFVPPKKAMLPEVKTKDWAQNELDYFVLEAMEEAGLSPNEPADKLSLIRRAYFDVIGLPPNPESLDRMAKDELNLDGLLDSLFANPAYGEKMAVHWMDLSRYADSHGYQDDYYRTQWPWRDWVIHAFNQNLPYDRFITWQLAGDLLPGAGKEQLLATAFNRNHKITEESGAIDEEYRVMYAVDRTNTLGKALLGMTLECAQCHDHKYDPISQKEYYQTFAFFNTVAEWGIEEASPGFSKKSPAKVPLMEIREEDVEDILHFVNMPDSTRRVQTLLANMGKGTNYNSLLAEADVLKVSVMGEPDNTRRTYLLDRGMYDAPKEAVEPGIPKAILPFPDHLPKNRLGLSKWLFDSGNPLTARVFVNRIWQEIFGKGLVATPGDFGMQGNLPVNQPLLDWLAVDFMESGWDIQGLIRKIMQSATYQQSSVVDPEKFEQDPENRLLSRFPRQRLPAEAIRDLVLASSGLLHREIGGPSVKPYQPEGLWEAATSGRGNLSRYLQDSGKYLYRRGLYTFIKRTVPPPSMMIFDASNRDACEVERLQTNTPLQALVMMNDPVVLEASRVLAEKLLESGEPTPHLIRAAFYRIVGRKAEKEEFQILLDNYGSFYSGYSEEPKRAKATLAVGEYPLKDSLPVVERAALMQVISLLYNLEETITKS